MRADYPDWLIEQKYAESARRTRIANVRKVEQAYGSLDEHFANGTYDNVIASLQYNADDERANKPNPSKISFDGDARTNLAMYKNAVALYRKFLTHIGVQDTILQSNKNVENEELLPILEESKQQRLSLERDMQAAIRLNIVSLHPSLKITDDGAERSVDSGLIDITCEDDEGIVVVELKAGKTDSRVIGQILGYMSDVQEEEGGRSVRGIIVAHDFDKRTRAAARVVPTLKLMKYAIEFKFTAEE